MQRPVICNHFRRLRYSGPPGTIRGLLTAVPCIRRHETLSHAPERGALVNSD